MSSLNKLAQHFNVVLKINKEERFDINDSFFENMTIINDHYFCGFGRNNNIVFEHCKKKLGMKENDLFIVLNPDVVVDVNTIEDLSQAMVSDNTLFATINLYKDKEYSIYDNSVRKYPTLSDFIKSFLLNKNNTIIDKKTIIKPAAVDWAAGSFLSFKMSHYDYLDGFDESYYMYCEDIDICYRSNKIGIPPILYPQFKAVHLAGHSNRKLLSKHFYWHLRSALKFLISK